jgi:hypothetical protein
MTREEIAEKVAWIIAGMAAEYHGRTMEPGQVEDQARSSQAC